MANKPYVVVEWNDTETDAKGWMCAYNFVGHYWRRYKNASYSNQGRSYPSCNNHGI